MRLLRQHHIVNLVAVVDAFLPRNASNPKGGRPVKLHRNETIALLLFSGMVAPQRTMQGVYTWAQTHYTDAFICQRTAPLSGSATRPCLACWSYSTSYWSKIHPYASWTAPC
jgi:hypothetical protein